MADTEEKQNEEKKTLSETAGGILIKYRKILLGLIIALILSAVIAGIVYTAQTARRKKGFAALDELTFSLTETRAAFAGDELTEKEKEIALKVSALAEECGSKAVSGRAYLLLADMEFQNKNWNAAKTAYISASESAGYISAVACYNAAVCCDELKDYDTAAEFFAKAADDELFPLRFRARFNLGRIYEQKEAYSDAAAQYQLLFEQQPGDYWANLAKTRLLSLQAEGKID